MESAGVEYEIRNAVSHITLNRPQASNSFDLPTACAFGAAVGRAAVDDTGAILVSGAGKRFCAGGDVASMAAATDRSTYLFELASVLDESFRRLAEIEKTVVAAVHGAVAGAGLGLMLSCDLVIASQPTKFLSAYAGVGLTPDCGVSYLLPRAVGQQRALQLTLTGRVLSAEEALDWGLVTEVVAEDLFPSHAERLATSLATGPAVALGQTKRLLRSSWAMSREGSGRDEASTIARMSMTPDAIRHVDKFAGA